MKHQITVIPIGPGSPDLLTLQAADLLRSGKPVCFRTEKHPVAVWLRQQGITYSTLDNFYENAEDFDEMNSAMVTALLGLASTGELLYAVPDPVSDQTVGLLSQRAPAEACRVVVLPGVSLADSVLAACNGHLSHDNNSYQLVSASAFSSFPWDPSVSLLITELDSSLLAGEVKLHLGEYLDDFDQVLLLPSSEELLRHPKTVKLCELDRQKHYDQTVSLLVPARNYLFRRRFCFGDLLTIMDRLRSREGCPWDGNQTHESLRPYLVEEAWEAVDAIDRQDMNHLSDELGDVLLQVVFHASIGASFDEFTITDVVSQICQKMLLRHPGVFDQAAVLPPEARKLDTIRDWEKLKQLETGSRTLSQSLNDVSSSLPSLMYASKVCRKLSGLPAFHRKVPDVAEEIISLSTGLLSADGRLCEEILGKLLIACAEMCLLEDRDAEVLLHGAVDRLKEAVQLLEKKSDSDGVPLESFSRSAFLSDIKDK